MRQFNALPLEGGLLDQPDFLMDILAMIGNIEEDFIAIAAKQHKDEPK